MKRRTGFTLIELLVVIAIIAILAAILFPVFASVRKKAFAANCQSNMKQLGSSIKMYLSDYDDTFPTNRKINGAMAYEVQLSHSADPPIRFQYGTNWVEGLYSYIERVAGADDASSVWRCQSSSNARYPATGDLYTTASVNYALNGYLCEQPEGVVKVASNTLMVRELDRIENAELRPWNMGMHSGVVSASNGVRPAVGTAGDRPGDPFLNTDSFMTGVTGKQHGKGSHILFADGHVKFFTVDYMPMNSQINVANSWDKETVQWYNYSNFHTTAPQAKKRTIGITP